MDFFKKQNYFHIFSLVTNLFIYLISLSFFRYIAPPLLQRLNVIVGSTSSTSSPVEDRLLHQKRLVKSLDRRKKNPNSGGHLVGEANLNPSTRLPIKVV